MSDKAWFYLESRGDILFASLHGSWDHKIDMEYLRALDKAANDFRDRPWGMLIDMRDWQLLTYEGLKSGEEYASTEFSRRNQTTECWVVPHSMVRSLMLQSASFPPGLSFKSFEDMTLAEHWLKSQPPAYEQSTEQND